LRSQYVRGERQLAVVGTGDQTDDRGQYRIYGLSPGEYFVSRPPAARARGDAARPARRTRRPDRADLRQQRLRADLLPWRGLIERSRPVTARRLAGTGRRGFLDPGRAVRDGARVVRARRHRGAHGRHRHRGAWGARWRRRPRRPWRRAPRRQNLRAQTRPDGSFVIRTSRQASTPSSRAPTTGAVTRRWRSSR